MYIRKLEKSFDIYGRPAYVVGAFVKELTADRHIDTNDITTLVDSSDQLLSVTQILSQCYKSS